jgi:hypothetical protein
MLFGCVQTAFGDVPTGGSPESKCPVGKACVEMPPSSLVSQPQCDRTKCGVSMKPDGSFTCGPCCPPGDLVVAGDYLNSTGTFNCQCPKPNQSTVSSGSSTLCQTYLSCPYYAFSVIDEGTALPGGAEGIGSLYTYSGTPLNPSLSTCLQQQVSIASSICGGDADMYSYWYDDCIAVYFGALPDTDFESYYGLPQKYSFNVITQTGTAFGYNGVSFFAETEAFGGIVYLDASCHQVNSPPPTSSLCDAGSFGWKESPVSLLWMNDNDVDADVTLTQFAVEPNKRGQYSLWKGSAKAPLLVYDPSHAGVIKDGTQLFGNWTFGGKRTASLATSSEATPEWQNGFEALASLDADGDGKIDGPELEPLALWFDENRNGIAEPGEVVPLSKLGVTALYYRPDRRDPITKSIVVSHGFERVVENATRTGAAVDWYSDSAATKEELLAKHMAHAELCNLNQPGQLDDGRSPPVDTPERAQTVARAKRHMVKSDSTDRARETQPTIAGLWRWAVENDVSYPEPKQAPQGYFTFSEDGKGNLKGTSYTELTFPQSLADATSMLSVSTFKGTRNEDKLSFTLELKGRTKVLSEARVLEGGKGLEGSSEATVNYKGKPITISYRWVAHKQE